MDRKYMVEQLTMYELEYLHDNFDKHTLTEVGEFFAGGGFNAWSDEMLTNKFNLLFSED
jgi:hypothetical protein